MLEVLTTIAALASGPFGALVITVMLLGSIVYGTYRLSKDWALPQLTKWLEKQDKRFEDILSSHAEDRKLFQGSIQLLADKIQNTDKKVDKIAEDLKELIEDIESSNCIKEKE